MFWRGVVDVRCRGGAGRGGAIGWPCGMGDGSGAGITSGQEVEVGFDLDGLARGLERFCSCGFIGRVAGEGRIVGVEGPERSEAAFFGFVVLDFAL